MKNFIFVGAILLGLGVLAVPGTASAHAPSIVGETQCRASADADWTVDWTVLPDERFADLTWSVVTGSGYSPSGSQSAGSTFTKTSTYTSADATGREQITLEYSDGYSAFTSAFVRRPPVCEDSTTTSTSSTTTTTTEAPTDTDNSGGDTTTTTSTTTTTTEAPTDTDNAGGDTTTSTSTTTTEAPTDTDNSGGGDTTSTSTSTTIAGVGGEAPTTVPGGATPTTVPGGGTPTTTGSGTPNLPSTGSDGMKDMLTVALLLFGFGGLIVSAARGRRSELLDV